MHFSERLLFSHPDLTGEHFSLPTSPRLQELQAHYDELQRQLQTTLDQYGVAQRRIQGLTAEYEEARGALDAVSIVEGGGVRREAGMNVTKEEGEVGWW